MSSPEPEYAHTQIGWPVIIPVDIGAAVCLVLAVTGVAPIAGGVTFVLLSITTALFYGLTVIGTREALTVRFGPGIISKSFPLASIASFQPSTTSFWTGWGIRYTIDGAWVFNISGFQAVKLTMTGGKTYVIGTDEPEKLMAFLERAKAAGRRP